MKSPASSLACTERNTPQHTLSVELAPHQTMTSSPDVATPTREGTASYSYRACCWKPDQALWLPRYNLG